MFQFVIVVCGNRSAHLWACGGVAQPGGGRRPGV